MNIKRMFVQAFVRRVVYLVVASMLVLIVSALEAKAANAPNTCNASTGATCSAESASAQCMAWRRSDLEIDGRVIVDVHCPVTMATASNGTKGYYTHRYSLRTTSGDILGPYNDERFYFGVNDCPSRAPLSSGWTKAGGETCSNGCMFQPSTSPTSMAFAGKTYYSKSGYTPTGAPCGFGDGSEDNSVTNDECTQVSGLTQCMKSNGQHCAVSSGGKQFCWNPTEAGTKASGNEAATKAPANTNINPPKNPPPNGGDWEQQSQGTSTTTTGGTTNNYNIAGWGSSYGPDGNGSIGDGSGDGDDDGDGPGQGTGETLGDLYTPHGKTIDSVVEAWWAQAQNTPLLGKINQFFGNCGYAGACPAWVYETEFTGTLSFAQLCDGTLGDIFTFGGFVVLAMGAFAAFRIAIY